MREYAGSVYKKGEDKKGVVENLETSRVVLGNDWVRDRTQRPIVALSGNSRSFAVGTASRTSGQTSWTNIYPMLHHVELS